MGNFLPGTRRKLCGDMQIMRPKRYACADVRISSEHMYFYTGCLADSNPLCLGRSALLVINFGWVCVDLVLLDSSSLVRARKKMPCDCSVPSIQLSLSQVKQYMYVVPK